MKRLDEKINKAEAEMKMRMWHEGTRGLNIKACSDEKLLFYLQTCIELGYENEALKLAEAAELRGLKTEFSAGKKTRHTDDPLYTVTVEPDDAMEEEKLVFHEGNSLNEAMKSAEYACMLARRGSRPGGFNMEVADVVVFDNENNCPVAYASWPDFRLNKM